MVDYEFFEKKNYKTYWVDTSSNGLVNRLLQTGSKDLKQQMEDLMQEKNLVVNFDEEIVFLQLDVDKNAVWSLLLASGYLKAEQVEYRGEEMEPWYHLRITNLETKIMFYRMFRQWFSMASSQYNDFVKALLAGNIREMNLYMNDVALLTFSNFDTGTKPSERIMC